MKKTRLRNHDGRRFQGTTVAELIELLKDQPADAIVVTLCQYGDYCRTVQALTLKGEADVYTVGDNIRGTAYSTSGFSFEDDDAGRGTETIEGDEEEGTEIVVLQ